MAASSDDSGRGVPRRVNAACVLQTFARNTSINSPLQDIYCADSPVASSHWRYAFAGTCVIGDDALRQLRDSNQYSDTGTCENLHIYARSRILTP